MNRVDRIGLKHFVHSPEYHLIQHIVVLPTGLGIRDELLFKIISGRYVLDPSESWQIVRAG